jgi:hypothetical protein
MVVEVLVPQRERKHPLRHQRVHRMLDQGRLPVVREARGKPPHDPSLRLHLPQQHPTPIRAQPTAVKPRLDPSPVHPWKHVLLAATLCPHKAASLCAYKCF